MARMKRSGEGGATALEFAIVCPVLLVMLLGVVGYGGYFWLSHSVQQLANDAARAAVAGLNAPERQALAASALSGEVKDYPSLDPSRAQLTVSDVDQALTVAVSYDASLSPFWSVRGLVPMPSTTIVRQATIRLGGY